MVSKGAPAFSFNRRACRLGRTPADRLRRDLQRYSGAAEQIVQSPRPEASGIEADHGDGDVVTHDGQRLVASEAQPLDRIDVGAVHEAQHVGDGFGRLRDGEREHLRAGLLTSGPQIVVEARQLDRPAHPGLYDLRAHTAAANQQPAVDEVLDGSPHRRPRKAQPLGQHDLVVQPGAGRVGAGLDELLQVLRHLEVQGTGLARSRTSDGVTWLTRLLLFGPTPCRHHQASGRFTRARSLVNGPPGGERDQRHEQTSVC